ncbi:helix-turn-helix transcriptional regulator [Mucilaginibacter rigui]|uniref:Helix-turn-helix transcriptional regulator n=1 Tax=Mucilaginibacter rigui TaxID=534635 RepID=A0ABR7X586_9SPHI|nr:helix-turn-helix transcriptional regulator [Mucilaginibacter rigui]MBD1385723.1 helix-turn-helix transcriptional regulator [Mucilaginibacter rigui]
MYSPGTQLKKLRLLAGLTQEELASKLSIKRNNISMIESGRNNPTFDFITSVCGLFNVTADYFLTNDDPATYDTVLFVINGIKNNAENVINNDKIGDYLNSNTDDNLNSKKHTKKTENSKKGASLNLDELNQGLTKVIQSNLLYLEFHLSDILLNLKFLNEKITGKKFDREDFEERAKSIKNMVVLLRDVLSSGHPTSKVLFNSLLNSEEAIRIMLDGIREQSKDLLLNSK